MARSLPYFKFTPGEWMTGDIVFESFEVQGLFINICALYWQREGVLTISDINNRYKKPKALVSLLGRFISVDLNDPEIVTISFLDEQFSERLEKSQTNKKNGSLGGRPKLAKTEDLETETKPNALFEEAKITNKEEDKEEEQDKEITIISFLNRSEAKELDPKFYEFIERYSKMLIREFPSDKEAIENIELSLYGKPARAIIKMASFDEITYVINKALNNEFWKPQLFNLLTIEKNWLKIKNTPDVKS